MPGSSAAKGAIAVYQRMRTNLPGLFADGDCADTHDRLLGTTYLPLGTTATKQGTDRRRERARPTHTNSPAPSAPRSSKCSTSSPARTGLRDHEATAAGLDPPHCRLDR